MSVTTSFDNTHANDSMSSVVVSGKTYVIWRSAAVVSADLTDKTAKSISIVIAPVGQAAFYTAPANVTAVSQFTGRVDGSNGAVIS